MFECAVIVLVCEVLIHNRIFHNDFPPKSIIYSSDSESESETDGSSFLKLIFSICENEIENEN